MANVSIVGNPLSDGGIYSGGSWVATLPLANLINRHPKKVARSSSAATADTQFVVDMQRVGPISVFALINHNFSNAATVRFRASLHSDGSSPLVDTTINLAAAQVIWGELAWGAFPWTGVFDDVQPAGRVTLYIAPAPVFARYILVNIVDTTNGDGYVQAGRFIAGESFSPTYNMSWGAGLKFVDLSVHSRASDGTLYSDVKPKYREFSGTLAWLTQAEAYGSVYELENLVGTTGGVLLIQNPDDDTALIQRRIIYGRLSQLDPIVTGTRSVLSPYSWTFTVEELI